MNRIAIAFCSQRVGVTRGGMRFSQSSRGFPLVAPFLLLGVSLAFAQPLFTPTQDPLSGARVFGAKGCSTCHGISGVGGEIGPDLGRIQKRPRSFYDLSASLWNHLPAMAARMEQLGVAPPTLTPQETGDLIAFLYTLRYFDPPGNVLAGKDLFTKKKCVVCHQIGGIGGVVGPNLDFLKQYGSPIFVVSAMWNHGPAMAKAMRDRGIVRPTFRGSELADLIAYIKSSSLTPVEGPLYLLPGRSDQGRRLFAEKQCVECHSVRGKGGQVAPDLAERSVHRSLLGFAAAMWNKTPAMMEKMKERNIPVPKVEAGEMADLVAYLYAVNYFAEAGDVRRGRRLISVKGCLVCHGREGPNRKTGPSFSQMAGLDSPATVIAGLWKHLPLMEQSSIEERAAWPRFKPQEMASLVRYLQLLARKRER